MNKRALITGITGMDGSHLADLLLEKGYEVHGIIRRCSQPGLDRISHVEHRLHLHEGDMLDQGSLSRVVAEVQPEEVYNLAAQSFVGTSWQQPLLTAEITGLGTLRMLEAIRAHAPEARFYQASSSEQYGNTPAPQNEDTPFSPRSPYGVAKVFAHHATVNYRESHGLHASCGILFNHESERRGVEFVTRKITRQVAEVRLGLRAEITLGNLTAERDWGYAPDYVRGMWMMLQRDEPDDFVLATGASNSVLTWLKLACQAAGVSPEVTVDKTYFRPAELHALRGDGHKARKILGWRPTMALREMVHHMVTEDLNRLDPGKRGYWKHLAAA